MEIKAVNDRLVQMADFVFLSENGVSILKSRQGSNNRIINVRHKESIMTLMYNSDETYEAAKKIVKEESW